MDKKTLIAILISFGIVLAWQRYNQPLPAQISAAQTAGATSANQAVATNSTPAKGVSATTPDSTQVGLGKDIEVTGKEGTWNLSALGGGFTNWKLNNYFVSREKGAANISLGEVSHEAQMLALAFDDNEFLDLDRAPGIWTEQANKSWVWSYEDSRVKLTREIQMTDNHDALNVVMRAQFKDKKPRFAFVMVPSTSKPEDADIPDHQLTAWHDKAIKRFPLTDAKEIKELSGPVKWIAAQSRYFIFSVVDRSSMAPKALLQPLGGNRARLALVYPVITDTVEIPVQVNFGPKDLNILKSLEPTLDHTVDFGWFSILAYPLLKGMKSIYAFVGNYGVAIIILTIILKILTFPLTYKSMKSMKGMSAIQPEIKRLQERYKDDKEALNREMLTLMKTKGYNPLAGCLPILIQMPIFFALFKVLYSSVELFHSPFYFWIQDLSTKDPYYVTPIILTGVMYVQQKLQPATTADPAQQKMMQFMPLMFGAFMITMPSGLAIYSLVNAVVSILQQKWLNKRFDTNKNGAVIVANAR